jgi:hypothetical protein
MNVNEMFYTHTSAKKKFAPYIFTHTKGMSNIIYMPNIGLAIESKLV